LENFLKEVILPNQELKLTSLVRNYGNGGRKNTYCKAAFKRQFCAVRLSGMGVALAPKMGR
jgi:hypothetical protein